MHETIDIDISHTVFKDAMSVMMYIIKDAYTESYIIVIPSLFFSCNIHTHDDYQYILKLNIVGDLDIGGRKRLVQEIKKGIAELEGG